MNGRSRSIESTHLRDYWLEIIAEDGTTRLERAAENGELDRVPFDKIGVDGLPALTEDRYSFFCHAAWWGQLNRLPRSLLTPANLLLTATETYETPLHIAAICEHPDQLLGVDLPEEAREILGEKWWQKHQEYLSLKGRAGESNNDPGSPAAGVEVDLG